MTAETDVLETIPRWAVMWMLAGALFLAGKVMMLALHAGGRKGWSRVGWLMFWPGMDAGEFFARPARPVKPCGWAWPAASLLLGLALIYGVARHLAEPLAAGWAGMIGLVLVLHFGLFALLARLWQAAGAGVTPIMNRPLAATSLAEFWGRRWNRAFRSLAHRLVFRPVARAWGRRTALWVSFLVSGLAHELVISVPAGAGYGLPTLYFALQAAGMVLERRLFAGVAAGTWTGLRWCFTHLFTAGPAFFLFHPPFVERVMIPFLRFILALP